MKSVDFLIIGGGAAGTTAAGVLRALKPQASITIISDENYEMYSRVLLPNYIRGEITRDKVFLKNVPWYEQNRVELVKNNKAEKLVPGEKFLETESGEQYKYGKLLIAIGAKPIQLKCAGADLGNIFYMWTLDDADGIIKASKMAKRGVVIGGGFIGLEFAHSFKDRGVETTILDAAPYYWGNRLDAKSSKVIQNLLEANGIKVICSDGVERFLGANGKVGKVVTQSGQEFNCDLVGVGIGVRSDFSWLGDSGLMIKDGIVTNEYLETNLADVYAAGDSVCYFDLFCKAPHLVATWANATTQGAAVAKTMSGVRTPFEAVSSYTINFFGGSCTFIGMTEDGFADEVCERGSVAAQKLSRFFLKNIGGQLRMVGATLVNAASEVGLVTSIIKNRVDLSRKKEKLADLDFDLKELE